MERIAGRLHRSRPPPAQIDRRRRRHPPVRRDRPGGHAPGTADRHVGPGHGARGRRREPPLGAVRQGRGGRRPQPSARGGPRGRLCVHPAHREPTRPPRSRGVVGPARRPGPRGSPPLPAPGCRRRVGRHHGGVRGPVVVGPAQLRRPAHRRDVPRSRADAAVSIRNRPPRRGAGRLSLRSARPGDRRSAAGPARGLAPKLAAGRGGRGRTDRGAARRRPPIRGVRRHSRPGVRRRRLVPPRRTRGLGRLARAPQQHGGVSPAGPPRWPTSSTWRRARN